MALDSVTEEGAKYTATVDFANAGTKGRHWRRLEVWWGGLTPSASGRASLRSLRVAGALERILLADTDPGARLGGGDVLPSVSSSFKIKNFSVLDFRSTF